MSYKCGMDCERFFIGPDKKFEGSRGEDATLSISQSLLRFCVAQVAIVPVVRDCHFISLIRIVHKTRMWLAGWLAKAAGRKHTDAP